MRQRHPTNRQGSSCRFLYGKILAMAVFTVKTQSFEGPLDLLLTLIEKRKLFINEISLAKIADDYVAHIRSVGDFPMAESAHFILVASTLLLIKSRSLLPALKLTDEEERDIRDLEDRLKLYARIRELSGHIKDRFGQEPLFAPKDRKRAPLFSPDESMTLPNLLAALKGALASIPKAEQLPKAMLKKVVSIEEMIGDLTRRIQGAMRMSFKEFSKGSKGERVNVIVSFLAMLELVKEGIIDAVQHGRFDDIVMESKEIGVPRY
jgi:segregation and condensation protein A